MKTNQGLKRSVASTNWYYELTEDEYCKVTDRDLAEDDLEPPGPSLYERLDKISEVYSVDYNGHFGPYIYYSTSEGEDHPLHDEVAKVIKDYIDGYVPEEL